MHLVDLGQCVAHAGTDGFACPLGVVTESSAASTESGGHGEAVHQRVPFAVKLLDPPRVAEFLGVLYFLGEGGQARFDRTFAVSSSTGSAPARAKSCPTRV